MDKPSDLRTFPVSELRCSAGRAGAGDKPRNRSGPTMTPCVLSRKTCNLNATGNHTLVEKGKKEWMVKMLIKFR